MENRKLGGILVVSTLALGGIVGVFMRSLYNTGSQLGCFESAACQQVQTGLGLSHAVVGILAFMISLGIYLMVFYKGEKAILEQLEQQKQASVEHDKMNIMMKMLDIPEQEVLKAINTQDGIEQSTLVLRTGLSKSKISEVLSGFERKNLITREKKGKTFLVHLRAAV